MGLSDRTATFIRFGVELKARLAGAANRIMWRGEEMKPMKCDACTLHLVK